MRRCTRGNNENSAWRESYRGEVRNIQMSLAECALHVTRDLYLIFIEMSEAARNGGDDIRTKRVLALLSRNYEIYMGIDHRATGVRFEKLFLHFFRERWGFFWEGWFIWNVDFWRFGFLV